MNKYMKNTKMKQRFAILTMLAVSSIASAQVLYSEDFNTGYTSNATLHGQNGWTGFGRFNDQNGTDGTHEILVRSRADISGGAANDYAVQVYGESDYGGRIGAYQDFTNTIDLNNYASVKLSVDVYSTKNYDNPAHASAGQGGINPEMLFLNYHIGKPDAVVNNYFGPNVNFNDPEGKYPTMSNNSSIRGVHRDPVYASTEAAAPALAPGIWITMSYELNVVDRTFKVGYSYSGGSFLSGDYALPTGIDFATFSDQSFLHISGDAEGNGEGTFYKEAWDNISVTATPVPEPSTSLLSLLAMTFLLKRNRNQG